MPRPPGGNGSAIAAYNRIISQALAEFPGHDLRLHRLIRPRRAFLHDLPPVFHSRLRGLEKASVLLTFQKRNQLPQGVTAVTDQSDLHRVAQSYTFGIEINLHSARLVRLGHELDIREGTADHQ